MQKALENFKKKSRHHSKLINFILPELKKIENKDILEFGVSDKAMSTELFLHYADEHNCKLYSIDNINYKDKFNNSKWNIIYNRHR